MEREDKYGLQYFPFHMYADFHKGLYKRFQFYGYNLRQEELDEYKKISIKSEKIRINFIKASIKAEIKSKDKVLNILNNIKDNEKLVCERMLSLL